ncbi:hypothetical protein TWF281_009803 [Arthrobotrys megalospora]
MIEGNGADSADTRKTLSRCFEIAREQFRAKHQSARRELTTKQVEFNKFLEGINIKDLERVCEDLGNQAEEKVNNASRLWSTLDMLKTVGDAFIDCAPESVSMVWFGISSLIQVGNAKLQTRLLICGTCDSIATIILDCIRWEARMRYSKTEDSAPKLEIWDSDVPELIFNILDFLWSAKPHFDQNRLKRLGNTLKDLFTKDLQQKVDALLEKYQEIVKIAQIHFEEALLDENFRTGTKLGQIEENINKFASISSELVDAVNRQALINEINSKRDKIKISETHKTHINALNDRLTGIIKHRGGRFVAGWLFQEEAYIDWKSQSDKTNTLYIKGPRGHGKSVAMMSVSRALSAESPLICHFFFKKGEQDIQQARTALESLLYQLLDSNHLRNDLAALTSAVNILNPGFGDPQQPAVSADAFLGDLASLSETIRMVAETIKQSVYLFIDALDECQDRRDQNLGQHLLSIAKTKSDRLRIIFSARDSIDVLDELPERPEGLNIIEITSEKNSRDLEEYLRHDVGAVLNRRVNQDRFPGFFNKELTRIVSIIHQKAKGDFTIARLILATLQQPSKESLETKIQRLPAAIGDIYMTSLESLTPDEQELIVVFLKWVVWSLSGMTVIEISDHYRELYKDRSTHTQDHGDGDIENSEEELSKDSGYDADLVDLIANDPYEDPDIKDVIHHLEDAGRDFFKIDRATGVVSVDISIREWIQEDPGSKSKVVESRGFHKSRDRKGNTVFKFTLTPSFVRYGDSLNELFVKREAQLSVTLNILRALNNKSFQDKYMMWEPEWFLRDDKYIHEDIPQPRYEIRYWQDHIRILQTWWNEDSLDDSWWSELLNQVSIFTRPENLQRWSIQVPDIPDYCYKYNDNKGNYLRRSFQQPIHVACRFGLRLMVDYVMRLQHEFEGMPNSVKGAPQNRDIQRTALEKRIAALLQLNDSDWPRYDREDFLGSSGKHVRVLIENMSPEELLSVFDGAVDINMGKRKDLAGCLTGWMLFNLDVEVIVAWLALNRSRGKNLDWFYTSNKVQGFEGWPHRGLDLEKETQIFLEKHGNDEVLLTAKVRELIISNPPKDEYRNQARVCDAFDPHGRLPLYLAAGYPDTVKSLIGYGADANKKGLSLLRPGHRGLRTLVPGWEVPLLSILHDIIYREDSLDEKLAQSMMQSATILVSKTTHLEEIKGCHGATLLHLAARIGSFDFFKLLCLSGRWNIHTKDDSGNTPMHYLFRGRRRPNDVKKVNEALDICRTMMNMRQPDGDDLVNAQNNLSQSPLAFAVGEYWVEAIKLLIDLGADVHDDDAWGKNCFHMLAAEKRHDEKAELEIATILFEAGVDCTYRGQSSTPLWKALKKRKLYLVEFFLEKYMKLEQISGGSLELFEQRFRSSNIFHWAAGPSMVGSRFYQGDATQIFGKLARMLLEYGVDIEDIRRLLLRVNGANEIPLQIAVDYCNIPAVKEIFALSPELKSWRPPYGETQLDRASKTLVSLLLPIERQGGSSDLDSDIGFLTAKDMTNYLLDCTPPISLVMFETALFDPGSTRWSHLNLQSIAPRYGSPFRDSSGWSLVDLLTHLKQDKIIDILGLTEQEISISGAEIFLKPSCIGRTYHPHGEVSEDRLEYYMRGQPIFVNPEGSFPWGCPTIFADHPVPPTGMPFYFEVQVSEREDLVSMVEVESLESGSQEDEKPFIMLGFDIGFTLSGKSRSKTLTLNYDGVLIGSDGDCPQLDVLQRPPQEHRPETLVQYVGCGLNPLQTKMFQTFNGVLQNIVELPTPARYIPRFSCSWHYESFKVNFGAEPFQFELANNPDWIWDESLLDGIENVQSKTQRTSDVWAEGYY